MRHIFIINPAAGKADSTEVLRRQIHNLKTEDAVQIYITKGEGDARQKAEKEATAGDRVHIYACGGDGTANEVLTGIAGKTNCAIGIIPLGSGNDFIKALEPYSKEDFLDIQRMVDGREKTIDLIECGGKYSMNVFSVGFDAIVAKNVSKFKRIPFVSGSLAYKLSIIYCLFAQRKHKVKILVDGVPFEGADYKNTTLLAVGGNGKYYGGGFKAAPKAVLDDGYMDFVHCKTLSVLRFASIVGKYKKGEHIDNPKMPFITFKRCKTLEFIAQEPIDINVDGEIYSQHNPKVRLVEGGLKIILPQEK
ncbi:MAG: YegS/Rv2252/BmrU family lipid kinase [Ruminococcus sp.]|nr:YegS/Rv2252/BmrU family lipid kinase [Ruminococcus sp.]